MLITVAQLPMPHAGCPLSECVVKVGKINQVATTHGGFEGHSAVIGGPPEAKIGIAAASEQAMTWQNAIATRRALHRRARMQPH